LKHQGPRCVTAHIAIKLPEDIQKLLWSLLDAFLSENVKSDYLQIFELSTVRIAGELLQKVIHRQELPVWEREEASLMWKAPTRE